MDKKGQRGGHGRRSVAKKRKFFYNQHTAEQETSFASTSAEKLKKSGNAEIPIHKEHGYCILNFFTVFSAISALVVCKKCGKDISFLETNSRGLGFKIAVQCSCGTTYIDSCPQIQHAFEINRRIVFAMRLLGIGKNGLDLFCGIMDIGQGLAWNTYYCCLENIYHASQAVFNIVTKTAVEEENTKNINKGNPPSELTVSGDGTWKKRGFSSLFGVTTLIGIYSNKVIDVIIKSSFCKACSTWEKKIGTPEYDNWKSIHEEECTSNHNGSAGKMEVDAVKEMFSRSEAQYNVKYITYVGDGDSKTFKTVSEAMVYGEDHPVKKKECVGHVQKRMGTRLRNAKKKYKGIGGKGSGKLTDKVINELTTYYGLAIRRNPDSLEKMKEAIWATYDHNRSTDANPHHTRCPEGATSWCAWRKAEAEGQLSTFKHTKPPLSDEVLKVIKPIYEDLTADNLLERCVGCFTQNNNESLNSLIWTFAPKHMHSGKKTVEIATYLAVCIFNEGFNSILHMLNVMGIKIGNVSKTFAAMRDNCRIYHSEKKAWQESKEARIARRQEQAAQNDYFEAEEGILYGPGIAD